MCEVDDADAIDAADKPVAEPLRYTFSSFNSLFIRSRLKSSVTDKYE